MKKKIEKLKKKNYFNINAKFQFADTFKIKDKFDPPTKSKKVQKNTDLFSKKSFELQSKK